MNRKLNIIALNKTVLGTLLGTLLVSSCDTSSNYNNPYSNNYRRSQIDSQLAGATAGNLLDQNREQVISGFGDGSSAQGLGGSDYFQPGACVPCQAGRPIYSGPNNSSNLLGSLVGANRSQWLGFGARPTNVGRNGYVALPPYVNNKDRPIYANDLDGDGTNPVINQEAHSAANHMFQSGLQFSRGNFNQGYQSMALARHDVRNDSELAGPMEEFIRKTDHEFYAYIVGEPYASHHILEEAAHSYRPPRESVKWGYLVDDIKETLIGFNSALSRGVFNVADRVIHSFRNTAYNLERQTYVQGIINSSMNLAYTAYGFGSADEYFSQYGDIRPPCCPY